MDYTDTHGNAATGVVWSPGPLPGTVWVLPYAGAPSSEAIVVHVRKREQVRCHESDIAARTRTMRHGSGYVSSVDPSRPLEVRAAHLQAFSYGAGLTKKDWCAALGYDPRDVVKGQAVQPDLFEATSAA